MQAMLNQNGHRNFRIFSRCKGCEPGMITEFIGDILFLQMPVGRHLDDLSGTRLASDRYPFNLCTPGGPVRTVDYTNQPLSDQAQVLIKALDLLKKFRAKRLYHFPIRVGHLLNNLRPVKLSAIGKCRCHLTDLQWTGQVETLPDRSRQGFSILPLGLVSG